VPVVAESPYRPLSVTAKGVRATLGAPDNTVTSPQDLANTLSANMESLPESLKSHTRIFGEKIYLNRTMPLETRKIGRVTLYCFQ
jgi:hypothetical protein